MASALLITDSDGVSILVIYKYALKTKKIEIIPFGLAELLIAFIAICKLISFLLGIKANSHYLRQVAVTCHCGISVVRNLKFLTLSSVYNNQAF